MSDFCYEAHRTVYDRLFAPGAVAVVGASDNPLAPGGSIYANLRGAFAGDVFAVNPGRTSVQGDMAHRALSDLSGPVDLVVIATRAEVVPALVEESISLGAGGAVVVSSGFAESDVDGAALQARLVDLSTAHSFPILGPNCVGFANGHRGVLADFSILPGAERPRLGPVAVVSQSGGFGSFILENAIRAHVNVGMFVSTGNEAGVTVASAVRYLVEWPEVRVLLVFSEALRDPDSLLEAADRAVALGKSIVVLKAGRSAAAARAALSHTASLVGSADAFDATCAQHGIASVESLEEMLDVGLLLQSGKRLAGRRVGVVTASGGAGVLTADGVDRYGLELPSFSEAEQTLVRSHLPAFGSSVNPVDVTGQLFSLPPERFESVLDVVGGSDVTDSVVAIFHSGEMFAADAIERLDKVLAKPVVAVTATKMEALTERGVPTYPDPVRAVRALGTLSALSELASSTGRAPRRVDIDDGRRRAVLDLMAEAGPHRLLLEHTSKRVLSAYGISPAREHVVRSAEEAVDAARGLAGPVALKLLSYDLPHKADSGAVHLGLQGDVEVAKAFRSLAERLGSPSSSEAVVGVLVQEMVPANLELVNGMTRDPVFGPMVMFGLGGFAVELVSTTALLRAPFTVDEAERAIRGYLGGRLVRHPRGLAEDHVNDIAVGLVGLGQLALEVPEVASIDVNPIRVSPAGAIAVDALIELERPDGH